MTALYWVPVTAVVSIHDRQIRRHGGAPGIRDIGLLEGACARPVNKHAYEGGEIAELAASYAFGIAKAHAFVDGNKRTAFVTAGAFLRMNGFGFRPDIREGLRMMEGLADGSVPEASIADWFAAGAEALTKD